MRLSSTEDGRGVISDPGVTSVREDVYSLFSFFSFVKVIGDGMKNMGWNSVLQLYVFSLVEVLLGF